VPDVNDVLDQELTSVGKDFYQVVPRLVALIFFTDGLKGGAGTGFGVYHSGGLESSFRPWKPNGVFTWEMSPIFVALIGLRARRLDRYLIQTDSMSSLKALKSRRPIDG
jgi:hypothetical protein